MLFWAMHTRRGIRITSLVLALLSIVFLSMAWSARDHKHELEQKGPDKQCACGCALWREGRCVVAKYATCRKMYCTLDGCDYWDIETDGDCQ